MTKPSYGPGTKARSRLEATEFTERFIGLRRADDYDWPAGIAGLTLDTDCATIPPGSAEPMGVEREEIADMRLPDKERCVARSKSGQRCDRRIAVKRHRLCTAHYKRYQRGQSVGSVEILERRELPLYTPPDPDRRKGICSVRGCGRRVPERARMKLCRRHYERYYHQLRDEGRPPDRIDLRPVGEAKHNPSRFKQEKKSRKKAKDAA